MKLYAFILLASMSLFSMASSAGAASPSGIKGPHIELFEQDHAFSGSILDHAVFGAFEHQPFGAKLQMRAGEATVVMDFARASDGRYLGELSQEIKKADGTKTILKTSIVFEGMTKTAETASEIKINIDGQSVVVNVSAEKFANGEFVAPTFHMELNQEIYNIHFTGQSCMSYTPNLALMLAGALTHLSKIN